MEYINNFQWFGPGWYATYQGESGVLHTTYVADPDLDRQEADEAARWQGYGTPHLMTEKPIAEPNTNLTDHTAPRFCPVCGGDGDLWSVSGRATDEPCPACGGAGHT